MKGMLVNFNQRRDAIDILFVDLNNPVDVLHMYPGNYNPSSVVNTESLVPVTAATDDVTVMGMQSDDIKLFLSALVNSYTKLSIRADQLYNMFVLFSREHSVVFVLSGTMFGRTIKTFSGVYSKRTKAGFIYQLDMEELKACLIKHHQYGEKAIIVCAQSNHSVDVPGASHVVDGA